MVVKKRKIAVKKASPKKGTSGPATKKVAKPATKKSTAKKSPGKRGGANRPVNKETGFVEGTESDTIAQALLAGGETRQAIIDAMKKKLSAETKKGTEKPVANMVAGVITKMLDRGFILEANYKLLPPTPASKRAATRRRAKK